MGSTAGTSGDGNDSGFSRRVRSAPSTASTAATEGGQQQATEDCAKGHESQAQVAVAAVSDRRLIQ